LAHAARLITFLPLGDYLAAGGYSKAFIDDHLMPFGAAVWSTSRANMLNYPAAAFIRFCDNHGLLKVFDRPQWKTVSGGSHHYVSSVKQDIEQSGGQVLTAAPATAVHRYPDRVEISLSDGERITADQVVLATHADTALNLLAEPDANEAQTLGVFRYDKNRAVLHSDPGLMPRRRAAWCSWNYVEQPNQDDKRVAVSYWMNRLQNLSTKNDFFVSLNPGVVPDPATVVRDCEYEHPIFNAETWHAQQNLWSLQGGRRTWFCGSYFGAGFHEDALQAGFAVAEQLGGIKRPWSLSNPSDRIVISAQAAGKAA